tara:strand:- start:19657 stop:20211 length:555 start_codon:yes stop_codon:yes gene_type:complete
MELFEIKNDQATFSPIALTLKPFAALWKRDKTKGKKIAISEMAALYFYVDYKSDFSTMLDSDEKLKLIKSVILGMPDKWEPDDIFKEACSFYDSMQETEATLLLEDAQYAIQSVRKFLRTVDLQTMDDRGKPIHDVKKIIDSLGSLHKVTEAMFELQEQVKKQIQKKDDTVRGGKGKAMFEDGL